MVEGILIGLAALCAIDFAVIVLYAGIGTSFAFIWLFFAALLLFLVYGKWYYEKNQDQIPLWVPVSIVTTCLAGFVSLAVTCALVFWGAAYAVAAHLLGGGALNWSVIWLRGLPSSGRAGRQRPCGRSR